MNLRSIMLQFGVAYALAGILAVPVTAQTTNNSSSTNTSTTGIQSVNDLVPLLVVLTGPQNWDYVGSSGPLGIGSNGGGNGQWVPVSPMVQAPAVPASGGQGQKVAASITTTDGRTFKHAEVVMLVPRLGDGLIIGDRVLLIYAEGSETLPLDLLPDGARKSLGLRTREEQASLDADSTESGPVKSGDNRASQTEKQRREKEAKFWADLSALVPDWRELSAESKLLDWLLMKDLGGTLDRQARARALAKWQVDHWEPWKTRNLDPVAGRPLPWAEPFPPTPY